MGKCFKSLVFQALSIQSFWGTSVARVLSVSFIIMTDFIFSPPSATRLLVIVLYVSKRKWKIMGASMLHICKKHSHEFVILDRIHTMHFFLFYAFPLHIKYTICEMSLLTRHISLSVVWLRFVSQSGFLFLGRSEQWAHRSIFNSWS